MRRPFKHDVGFDIKHKCVVTSQNERRIVALRVDLICRKLNGESFTFHDDMLEHISAYEAKA